MKRIADTKRLILREFEVTDAHCIFDLNSDPEVLKFTGDQPFKSILEAENFIKGYREYATNGYGRWAVISKEYNTFLGWCGLKLNEEKMVDLGFRFQQREWNRGYATEAAYAAIQHGFEHYTIDEIIGRTSVNNRASIRVLEKVGMQFWKNDRCEGIDDAVYYRIQKEQFMNQQHSK